MRRELPQKEDLINLIKSADRYEVDAILDTIEKLGYKRKDRRVRKKFLYKLVKEKYEELPLRSSDQAIDRDILSALYCMDVESDAFENNFGVLFYRLG